MLDTRSLVVVLNSSYLLPIFHVQTQICDFFFAGKLFINDCVCERGREREMGGGGRERQKDTVLLVYICASPYD